MFDLSGRTALVTGAASGIGKAISETFAAAHARVWVADLNVEDGEGAAQSIREAGGDAAFVELDVTRPEACEAARSKTGPLDILVNNAGIGRVGTILETDPEDMESMFAVNVMGVFNVSKAYLPDMLDRGRGSIVNMSSIGGVIAVADRLAYCMSKFAVTGITKAMALDHSKTGVRINCICPGRVETPFVQARIAEYPDPEQARKDMSATQLAGRMIRPDEVAAAALYLAADESAMVTGSTFMIDSGWSAGR